MEISHSATKHGISEADVEHAFRHAIRFRSFEYGGEEQVFIHADRLRPKFFDLLR